MDIDTKFTMFQGKYALKKKRKKVQYYFAIIEKVTVILSTFTHGFLEDVSDRKFAIIVITIKQILILRGSPLQKSFSNDRN